MTTIDVQGMSYAVKRKHTFLDRIMPEKSSTGTVESVPKGKVDADSKLLPEATQSPSRKISQMSNKSQDLTTIPE